MNGHRLAAYLGLGTLVVFALAMALTLRAAALPDRASGKMLAVFSARFDEDRAFAAIVAAGGKPVRPVVSGFVWVVASDQPGFAGRLKRQGALGAYRKMPLAPQLAGCFAYVDAKALRLINLQAQ